MALESFEKFITIWNAEMQEFPLSLADLKDSHKFLGALLQITERLGIDRQAILGPPPESEFDENTMYYKDFLPILNMIRVIKFLGRDMPVIGSQVTVLNFLQPNLNFSRTILFLLFNLTMFNEERSNDIAEPEKELFGEKDKVKKLENRLNELKELLNESAKQKGSRTEKCMKVQEEINQLEAEVRVEQKTHDEEKQLLNTLNKEYDQIQSLITTKRNQKDGLQGDISQKKSMRVCDADDIKAQAEQVAINKLEFELKANTLRDTVMERETRLNNIQSVVSILDEAKDYLDDFYTLSMSIRKNEDETEVKDVQLQKVNLEISELEAQLSEVKAEHDDVVKQQQKNQENIEEQTSLALKDLHDAEEKHLEYTRMIKDKTQCISEVQESTVKYKERRNKALAELAAVKENFTKEIKAKQDDISSLLTEYEENLKKRVIKK